MQQRSWIYARPVIHLDSDLPVAAGPEESCEQIIAAKRRKDESQQLASARFDRFGYGSAPVHGHKDHKASLRIAIDLLAQRRLAAHGRQAAVASALHGGTPRRIAPHVVADRREVARIQRLQVQDALT